MRETRAMRRGEVHHPPPASSLRGGGKPPEDMIERTPEYLSFMEDLEEFHRSHGTSLQREPVLGSKKLDLYRIYKMVCEAGGCQKVSEERGWKKITLPFNFPVTCTNSAYVMKNLYIKFLEGYEMENFWGKEVPYGGLKVSTTASSSRSYANGGVGGGHDSDNSDQSDNNGNSNISNNNSGDDVEMGEASNGVDSYATNKTHMRDNSRVNTTVMSRRYNAPLLSNKLEVQSLEPPAHRGSWREGYYLEGGHHNRMLLALRSTLPNEIDWAFKRLTKLSHECSDSFHVDRIPGLVDALLAFVAPFFEDCAKLSDISEPVSNEDNFMNLVENDAADNNAVSMNTFFDSIESQQYHQRVLQAFLIIRNFSFLEHNMRLMAAYKPLRKYLIEGLKLKVFGNFIELRHYCLDIVENICPYVILKGLDDPFMTTIPILLYSNDKALIMGGIRSLTRLALNESNITVLRDIEAKTVQRMIELLLIEDEELVAAVLDWLYQFSDLHEDMAYRIAQCTPGNFVRLMIRFMRWQAFDTVKAAYDDIMPIVPKLQLSGPFVDLPEPYRTIEWLKIVYEYVPNESLLQTEVWFAYREQFFNSPTPMMPAAEVIKHVTAAFPKAVAMMVTRSDGTTKYPLYSMKTRASSSYLLKKLILRENTAESFTCRWDGCTATPFSKGEDVYQHIIYNHLQQNSDHLHDCLWKGCHRYSPGTANRSSVLKHLKIHFPIEPDSSTTEESSQVKLDQRRNFLTQRINVSSDADGEAIGIPLTACLILRNMSRSKKTIPYFTAYETELSDILAKCRPLSKYLSETMSNLRNFITF
ncbi:2054_t:CDS:2 [Ambispora leptoticha]|uniref:2054_t:CDS:1 n=1 Tax=Ambispora leptoticha TaxID=144679 RepID=A0A9N8VM72_9GLOM|nr:2054_t:CDS:2 [Ambispora leptoticha]